LLLAQPVTGQALRPVDVQHLDHKQEHEADRGMFEVTTKRLESPTAALSRQVSVAVTDGM
jgi:hypothetical protein